MGVADQAGSIKAETGLKLPDAIVVASAVRGGANCLILNDESLKKASKFIRVVTSKEFVDGEELERVAASLKGKFTEQELARAVRETRDEH